MRQSTRPKQPRSALWGRVRRALLLGTVIPTEHRDASYRPLTTQQHKAKARRRAANKVARQSRRINRVRAGR